MVTGVVFFNAVVGSKRLELLRQVAPKATTIGMLVNPKNPSTEGERRDVQAAAQAVGQQLIVLDVSSGPRDIEPAFATFMQRGAGALLVGSGVILELPSRARCRACGPPSAAGDQCETRGRRGRRPYELRSQHFRWLSPCRLYAGRILKGEKPADLPVMQATKFEFVINLKTAKALGVKFPTGCSRSPTR